MFLDKEFHTLLVICQLYLVNICCYETKNWIQNSNVSFKSRKTTMETLVPMRLDLGTVSSGLTLQPSKAISELGDFACMDNFVKNSAVAKL